MWGRGYRGSGGNELSNTLQYSISEIPVQISENIFSRVRFKNGSVAVYDEYFGHKPSHYLMPGESPPCVQTAQYYRRQCQGHGQPHEVHFQRTRMQQGAGIYFKQAHLPYGKELGRQVECSQGLPVDKQRQHEQHKGDLPDC